MVNKEQIDYRQAIDLFIEQLNHFALSPDREEVGTFNFRLKEYIRGGNPAFYAMFWYGDDEGNYAPFMFRRNYEVLKEIMEEGNMSKEDIKNLFLKQCYSDITRWALMGKTAEVKDNKNNIIRGYSFRDIIEKGCKK